MNKVELDQLAQQLMCPNGEVGVNLGKQMSDSNKGMIMNSIIALHLQNNNKVLEIGHGNCEHLNDIMQTAKGIKYFGFELSKTMVNEAIRINHEYVKNNKALFQSYDGNKISYVVNFFDRILTVNTIYFWKKPSIFLEEMYRVLKPEGIFTLTFVDKEFMKNLPFTNSVFSLFDKDVVKHLVISAGFKVVNIENKSEYVESKTGEMVHRKYSIFIFKKK